jgi:hypothetical protein
MISTDGVADRGVVEFLGRGRAHRGVEARHDVEDLLLAGEISQRDVGQILVDQLEVGRGVADLGEVACDVDGVACQSHCHVCSPD